jgi:hypothetical protein
MKNLHKKYIDYIRAIVAGTITGFYIVFAILVKLPVKSEAVDEPVVIPTTTPTATPRYCGDPISYIRCKGEDLGYSNEVIKTMIRIAKAESGLKEKAKNPSSTASGLFQFLDGSWKYYKCRGSKLDFIDSTNCAYEAFSKDGFRPWASSASKWL